MKAWWIGTLAVGALCWVSPVRADVRVTIGDGRVSISATNATVRQVLAEWAKIGQARIVNLERVAGPPTTIEISNASEIDALEILLRSVGGYIIAPRHADIPNASRFDRIVILPVSSVPGPAVVRPATAGATFSPPPSQLLPPPRRLDDDADDGDGPERGVAPTGAPGPRPATFSAFPQPARGGPQPQAVPEPAAAAPPPPPPAPSARPTAPAGVPVPGMMLPVPQTTPGSTPPR